MTVFSAAEWERRARRSSEKVETLRRERDRLRRRIEQLESERDGLLQTQHTPFTLTELHEYWLATKTPDEIVRIAQGLSEWDVAA